MKTFVSKDSDFEERLPGDENAETLSSTRHGKAKTHKSTEAVIEEIEKKADAPKKPPIHRKV